MQFSITVQTKIDDWKLIAEAEALGYDRAWVPDTQMLWSDCYATLALAAQNTSRISLGTGVAVPGTRIAPVTAHSIASINRIAPGRTFLGIGTGHTAMRVMGMSPAKPKAFREYIQTVRTLLRGEEVDFTLDGVTRSIQFLHQDLGFLDLEHPIPIYVAANGPAALRVAGGYGDGLVSLFNEQPEVLAANLENVREGARRAGRALPSDYHTATLTTALLLKPGESLESDRVIDECGSWVTCSLHFVYEIYQQTGNEHVVPDYFGDVFEEYCAHVERMSTPPEKRYRQIHDGHCTFVPREERRFVTPKGIEGCCLIGEPEELVAKIRKAEAAGLKEVSLLPPMAAFRKVIGDFAREVMRRY